MTSARAPEVTSRMMSAVRSRNTKAEMLVRRELHRRGVRFRLHAKDVVGRPDIVWRGRRLAVFIDGDFWHGNAWRLRGLRSLDEMFPTRREWWVAKIRRNEVRDEEVNRILAEHGWTVLRFWESDVLTDVETVADRIQVALGARPS